MFSRLTVRIFRKLLSACMYVSFPFGFEGGLRYLIVFNLVPERCLFFLLFKLMKRLLLPSFL